MMAILSAHYKTLSAVESQLLARAHAYHQSLIEGSGLCHALDTSPAAQIPPTLHHRGLEQQSSCSNKWVMSTHTRCSVDRADAHEIHSDSPLWLRVLNRDEDKARGILKVAFQQITVSGGKSVRLSTRQ